MLEGIEILEKIEITSVSDSVFILCVCTVIVFFISLSAILAGAISNSEDIISGGCIVFAISLMCALLSLSIAANFQVPTGRYKYKVIIDDSVSINEFYEKYDVIEKNGKIWTITDKGVE